MSISWRRHDRVHFVASLALSFIVCSPALAQEKQERTADEIKVEAIHRAENGMYPLIGLDPADLKEAFASIHTKDKDEWASAFMAVADRYMNEGKSIEKTDPTKANADYIRAWRLLLPLDAGQFLPHPASSALAKEQLQHFLPTPASGIRRWKSSTSLSREEKSSGTCACRKIRKVPPRSSLQVNGLDSRKEDLAESFSAILPCGIGYLAVDGPGTGQSPIKVSETAERSLSRVLDYLQTRPEVDKTRIAIHGVSWGAYWATKMAISRTLALEGCQRSISSGR